MKPLTIGQVASRAGITVEAVRFYEREGLLPKPDRSGCGYRLYPEEVVLRLRFIHRAKHFGFTLCEVKALLALYDDPEATMADVRERTERKAAEVEEQIRTLMALKHSLAWLRGLCEGDGPARDCPILRTIAAPSGPGEEPDFLASRCIGAGRAGSADCGRPECGPVARGSGAAE